MDAATLILAVCLALAPAIAIGFGRFGYALILPAMRADLGWTYSQAGALNTANAAGYLLGALLTTPALMRLSNHQLMLCGLLASVAALFLAGATHSFVWLLGCRALVGFTAAFTFIAATGLAARLGKNESQNALALGLAICGPGFGTVLTGILVPFTLERGQSHWPTAWRIMGLIGAIVLAMVAFFTRRIETTHPAAPVAKNIGETSSDAGLIQLWPVLLSYFLFGLGYIAYMTFLVAYVRSLRGSAATVALVWVCLGCAMLLSTFVWRSALSQNGGGKSLAAMGFGGAFCAILPLLSNQLPVLILSAVGFGLTAMPIFTAVTILMRRHLAPGALNAAIATATVIFALGQSLGPLGSGQLSDRFGLSASLWWTASIMMLAGLVALGQKPKNEAKNEGF